MTETATEIYVTCQDFCGARITQPGPDGHAAGCGAPKKEMKRLDAELKAKRIQATAAAAQSPDQSEPPKPYVCSCNAGFDTWEELGAHQTETGHTGCATDDLADDEALHEREDTVDGEKARIDHNAAGSGQKVGEKVDYSHLWGDPFIDMDWVFALQARIDDGTLTIGGIAAGKACIGKATFTDPKDGSPVEVGCPHRCFARTVRSNECSLEHTHTETLEQVCLIHGIVSWGGLVPAAGNGPLFGASS